MQVFRHKRGGSAVLVVETDQFIPEKMCIRDRVIDAMGAVGMKMDVSLRETSLGGVAVSPRGVEIAEKLGM